MVQLCICTSLEERSQNERSVGVTNESSPCTRRRGSKLYVQLWSKQRRQRKTRGKWEEEVGEEVEEQDDAEERLKVQCKGDNFSARREGPVDQKEASVLMSRAMRPPNYPLCSLACGVAAPLRPPATAVAVPFCLRASHRSRFSMMAAVKPARLWPAPLPLSSLVFEGPPLLP